MSEGIREFFRNIYYTFFDIREYIYTAVMSVIVIRAVIYVARKTVRILKVRKASEEKREDI